MLTSNFVSPTWSIDPKAFHVYTTLSFAHLDKSLATRGFLRRCGVDPSPTIKSVEIVYMDVGGALDVSLQY